MASEPERRHPSLLPRPAGGRRGAATAIELGANQPLRLDRPRQAWRVIAGQAEVFCQPFVGESPAGPRTHLFTVAQGGLILSFPSDGDGMALLAVGALGTRVIETDPEGAADELNEWVTSVSQAIAPRTPVELDAALAAGTEIEVGAGAVVRPVDGLVWVRHREGRSTFLGEAGAEVPAGVSLPLTERTWLRTGSTVRLEVADTQALVEDGDVWPAIDGLHRLVHQVLVRRLDERSAHDRDRLRQRLTLDRGAMEEANRRLAAVLTPIERFDGEVDRTVDPLLAACRLVGQPLALDVQAPRGTLAGTKREDAIGRIAEASRVRYRRVLLKGRWWRRDNGPLVAFRILDIESDGEAAPVALLPTPASRYELIDPASGDRRPVDAALAAELDGIAFMFYPPLPDRPLTKGDLLAAGLRGRQRDLMTIVGIGIASGLLALLTPIVTGRIFGGIIPQSDRNELLQMTLALFVAALAGGIFQVSRSLAVLRISGKFDGALQAAVWDRLLRLPVAFFRRFSVGDLANRSMGIDFIRDLFTGNVATSILAAVFSLFSFALLFYYSWRLALLATGMVAVMIATTLLLVLAQLRHQRKLFHIGGRLASLLFELINGIAKLRIAGAESRAYGLWAERFTEQRRVAIAARRVANAQVVFNSVYPVLTALGIFAIVGFSSRVSLPIGEFLAFSAAFGQFLAAALSMVGVVSGVLTMVPVYERLRPVLEAVPEVDTGKSEPGELRGDIELSQVSFRYREDGPLVLEDLSFRALPGEFVALVGPSGSGKSTCLRLLLAFERPESGSIYFDGQDLDGLHLRDVRRQIGVVLQTGRLMAGDIYSNIVGSTSLSVDDAWEAARLAGLDKDIKEMPMGMHTVVGEGAGTFSGGQKQRLLIARAIVNRPRIVLFDEATSALDNRTQAVVSESLERLKATRIVIAHRLSTIVNADRIYVIDRGKVVGSGSYRELLEAGGLFSELARRQIA